MILLTVYPIPTIHPEIIYKKPYYMDSAVCFYIFMIYMAVIIKAKTISIRERLR